MKARKATWAVSLTYSAVLSAMVALKAWGVLDWSWWWVFVPVLGVGLLVVALGCVVVAILARRSGL